MYTLTENQVRVVAGGVDSKIPVKQINGPSVTVPDISMPMQSIPMAQVAPSPCSLAAFGRAANSGLNTGATYGIDAADQAGQMGDDSPGSQGGIILGNMAIQADIAVAKQAYRCATQ